MCSSLAVNSSLFASFIVENTGFYSISPLNCTNIEYSILHMTENDFSQFPSFAAFLVFINLHNQTMVLTINKIWSQ